MTTPDPHAAPDRAAIIPAWWPWIRALEFALFEGVPSSEDLELLSDLLAWLKQGAAEQTIDKLRNALLDLCDLHHRTLTGSAKHNPARVSSIHECECLSCRRVSAVLRETEQK